MQRNWQSSNAKFGDNSGKSRVQNWKSNSLEHKKCFYPNKNCIYISGLWNKKSPQIVRLSRRCARKCFSWQTLMRIHWTLWCSATTMTSHRLSIQSVAPSATVWPQFPCQVLTPLPNSTPHLGSKMVAIEISSPHSYSTSIHTRGLSCTV